MTHARDCLQRFNDDLTADLLAYLPFDSKVRFESVCRQWKRCVFRSQSVLSISSADDSFNSLNQLVATDPNTYDREINQIAFESIVKKCPFIRKISFFDSLVIVSNYTVELIGNYCHNLIELKACSLFLSEDLLRKFGEQCGRRLKSLEIKMLWTSYDHMMTENYSTESMQMFLALCPNLERLSLNQMKLFAKSDATLLPKLKSLEFGFENDDTLWISLIDKYKTNIKCLKLKVSYDTILDINSLIRRLNRITDSCQAIQVFHLTVYETKANDNIFASIGRLRNLIDLKITVLLKCELSETASLSAIKGCQRLARLTLTGVSVNDSFFADIDHHLPNLNRLEIHTDCVLTNTFLNSVAKLKQLTKLVLEGTYKSYADMTDDGVCDLIVSCPRLRVVDFDCMPNITNKTLVALIEKANTNEKIEYQFYLRNKFEVVLDFPNNFKIENIYVDQLLEQYNSARIDFDAIRHLVPTNLKIDIKLPEIIYDDLVRTIHEWQQNSIHHF